MKLENNTVLITGGTSGLGLGLAQALLKHNTVIVTSRRPAVIEQVTAENPGLIGYPVDVSDLASVERLKERILNEHPTLNMVINSAGIMQSVNFFDAAAPLSKEIETNLIGTINVDKVFLPLLAQQPEATLVNITSGLAYVASTANPIYSASKSGVGALTEAIRGQADYFGHEKLHIIQVAPPLVSETNLNPAMHENGEKNPLNMKLADFVPLVIKGIEKDKAVINPGPSKLLNIIGRFAPMALRIRAMKGSMATEFVKK
ncbi:MAG: SDR family NAD(P)-dependent oxidoreductase [Enterococcus viikkiensis]|uniref:SDR family NAD(P)-dependent oxidoreductase n=1 Tax=Enterococcus viikkiensis TaxID=930854 RepID=UPI003F8E3AE0